MNNVLTFSHAGGHTANEDAFLTQRHPDDDTVLICALADGQGGRPGGAEAAERACTVALETAISYSPKYLSRQRTWTKILGEADNAVRDLPEAGATTLVALCITEKFVCGASSGDCSAVLLNIHDQFHRLTAGQLKNPPVGSGQAKFVPFRQRLIDPWLVLLMTDGLWKYAGRDRVHTLIKRSKGQALVNALTREARVAGRGTYRDDTTFIIVESGPVQNGSMDDEGQR